MSDYPYERLTAGRDYNNHTPTFLGPTFKDHVETLKAQIRSHITEDLAVFQRQTGVSPSAIALNFLSTNAIGETGHYVLSVDLVFDL